MSYTYIRTEPGTQDARLTGLPAETRALALRGSINRYTAVYHTAGSGNPRPAPAAGTETGLPMSSHDDPQHREAPQHFGELEPRDAGSCCDEHGRVCAEPNHEPCCMACPNWANHCQHRADTYDEDDEMHDPAEDYCVHCECCCTCLGCEYGPRDGLIAAESCTPQQAAVLAALREEGRG